VREHVDAYDLCAAWVSVQATIGERTGCTDLLDDANTVVFDGSVEPCVVQCLRCWHTHTPTPETARQLRAWEQRGAENPPLALLPVQPSMMDGLMTLDSRMSLLPYIQIENAK